MEGKKDTTIESSGSVLNMANSFSSVDEATIAITHFMAKTNSSFAVNKTDGEFGKPGIKFEKHRILFEDISKEGVIKQIQFTGYPFLVTGMKRMECSHGVDRDKERKLKRKLENSTEEEYQQRKSRSGRISKKMGCPASILLRDIIFFNDDKIEENIKYQKSKAISCIRQKIDEGTIHFTRRILVKFPDPNSHEGHSTDESAGSLQRLDKSIIEKIQELVIHGIDDINELENLLHEYVAKLFHGDIPPITCRKFFPEPKDIRNHVYRIKAQMNTTSNSHPVGNSTKVCAPKKKVSLSTTSNSQQTACGTNLTMNNHHQFITDKREKVRFLCNEVESLLDTCDPKVLDDLEERLRQIRDSMVPACISEQDVVSSKDE
eukprot:TCONS_00005899-protein